LKAIASGVIAPTPGKIREVQRARQLGESDNPVEIGRRRQTAPSRHLARQVLQRQIVGAADDPPNSPRLRDENGRSCSEGGVDRLFGKVRKDSRAGGSGRAIERGDIHSTMIF
jgi:hypothetical protein